MPLEKIVSLKNESIKKVASLRERKTRDSHQLTVIDGVREFQMALKAGVDVREFYFCPSLMEQNVLDKLFQSLDPDNVRLIEVSSSVFEKINFGDRNEGMAAVIRQPQTTWADIKFNHVPFIVVVEAIEKPGNLGAILRTCDAASVDGLIVCDGRTDVYNPNVIRASLGAVFTVPVISADRHTAVDFLRKHKMKTVGTFPEATKSFWQSDLRSALAIVLGSEQDGLSDFWRTHAQEHIQVPMQGTVNSLNVSITAALMVYETVRQRI